MQLQMDESLKTRIPGVTFGMVTVAGVMVHEHDERLWSQIEALCQRQVRRRADSGASETGQFFLPLLDYRISHDGYPRIDAENDAVRPLFRARGSVLHRANLQVPSLS